jgi:hypothetical protein
MLEKLYAFIEQHVQAVADRRHWQKFRSEEFGGQGGICDYLAGNLLLRIVNERGLIDLEIGAAAIPSSLRSASFYRDLLDPPAEGRWNMGVGDETKFVDKYWDDLQRMLAPDEWQVTIEKVDATCRRTN